MLIYFVKHDLQQANMWK